MISLTLISLAVFVASWLFSATLLWVLARLFAAENATFLRANLVVFILVILGIVTGGASLGLEPDEGLAAALVFLLCAGLVQILITLVLLQRILGTTLGRAFAIWLIHSLANAGVATALIIGLKTFVMAGYVVPTNAMAPTIFGYHRTAPCPLCQQDLVVPGPDPTMLQFGPREAEEEELGICTSCRQTSKVKLGKLPIGGPDRILVSHLLKPQRWDTIVYRFPPEPTKMFTHRLVGLPGEKLQIKEGAVWINDARLDPPAHLAGLHYVVDPLGFRGNDEPGDAVVLGANEYYVLGDFSLLSDDSRSWGPLPGENIESVVCAIYWPPSRWTVFR